VNDKSWTTEKMWSQLSQKCWFLALAIGLGLTACVDNLSETEASVDPQEPPFIIRSTEEDWVILEKRIKEAFEQRLDLLPMGDLVARIGLTFLGTPYAPNTLDPAGEEGLVVEVQELDCVTFVETVLALSRVVHDLGVAGYRETSSQEIRRSYWEQLEALRYRDGHLDGYLSRLHYFSDWIKDNAKLGVVEEVFESYPARIDTEPITFMTAHPDAYWQLREDPTLVPAMKKIEEDLSQQSRAYIPEINIYDVEQDILNGDIVAATSSLAGLDIAHTGIAIRKEGRVHLLHAPLVGGVVQVSAKPLAERILELERQDGVMIARPLD